MKRFSNMTILVSTLIAMTLVTNQMEGQRRHRLRSIRADVSEKKISKSAIPAAVLKSFEEHFPTAVISRQLKQTREKAVYYALESVDSTKDVNVLFEPDGTIVEVAETMEVDALPPTLRDSVLARYPSAVIRTVESVTRDKHVEYELTMNIGKKKLGVVVNSAGKVFVIN